MVYRSALGLAWVQETEYVRIVDPATGAAHVLTGPEAVVWDWLNSGHTGAEAASLLALTYDLAEAEARARLVHLLARWQVAGLVEAGRG